MNVVYKIENLLNGKCYIGQTNNFVKRMNQHFYASKQKVRYNSAIYNAIKKYGWNSFAHEIIYKDIHKCKLDIAEMCAIYTYDSYRNGYNSTTGGGSGIMEMSMETRRKMSESAMGRKGWNKGLPRRFDVKAKLSKSMKNWHKHNRHPALGTKREDVSERNRKTAGKKHPSFGKSSWNKNLSYKKSKLKIFLAHNTDTNESFTLYGIEKVKDFSKKYNISYSSFLKYRKSKNFTLEVISPSES